MRFSVVTLLWSTLSAFAQFDSLSTNFDGSRLYFTSVLQQSGTEQPDSGKAFVADAAGIRPLLVRNREVFPGLPNTLTTNFYNLVGVDIAANTSHLAIVGSRECLGLPLATCRASDQTTVYNTRGEEVFSTSGYLALSPNGRWGLATTMILIRPSTQHTVVDLMTKVQYPFPAFVPANRNWRQSGIADDGTAVSADRDSLLIFRPPDKLQAMGIAQTIRGTRVTAAAIDAGATTVVWSQGNLESSSLRVLKLSLAQEPLNLQIAGQNDFDPRISDDGSRLLFLSTLAGANNPQVFTMRTDGSGRRQITAEPEGIATAILSGDGQVAWVLTRSGRVLRVEIQTANRTELIGPVAAILPSFFIGLQARPLLEGAIGQPITVLASVKSGDRIAVEIDGNAVPVLKVEDQSVTFQTPWELEANRIYDVSLSSQATRGWTGASSRLRVRRYFPAFLRASREQYALAAHQNFDAAVTPERPARPGEIVHLYAAGLGTVSPPVPTGIPAPASPLSILTTEITCNAQLDTDATPVHVLYAGLAPGTIGYYQLDLRLPQIIDDDRLIVRCELRGLSSMFSIPLPVRP